MFCKRNSENVQISLHFQEEDTATLPSDSSTNQHAKVRRSRRFFSGVFTRDISKKKNRDASAIFYTDNELGDDPGSDSLRRRGINDPLPVPGAPATAVTYDSTFQPLPPPLPLSSHHNLMVPFRPRSASSPNIGVDHGDDDVFSAPVIGRVKPIPTRVTTNTVRNHHHTIEF